VLVTEEVTGRCRGWYPGSFFGDSFHFGFFPGGWQSLAQALDAHTDLVCELAGIRPGMGPCRSYMEWAS